jgi:hypothetical protein
LLPLLCGLRELAHAEPATDAWAPPDELLTAQNLSKLITGNQRCAAIAGVAVLLLLLGIAYLIPLIRAPRWQILGIAVLPVVVAFGTMAALSRPVERNLQKIPYEEMRNVIDSEVAPSGDKAIAERILRWQGEIEGRSFLIDVGSMPLGVTFVASAALMAALWLLSHHRVLRAS